MLFSNINGSSMGSVPVLLFVNKIFANENKSFEINWKIRDFST